MHKTIQIQQESQKQRQRQIQATSSYTSEKQTTSSYRNTNYFVTEQNASMAASGVLRTQAQDDCYAPAL